MVEEESTASTGRATGGGNYGTLIVVAAGVVALVVVLALLSRSDDGDGAQDGLEEPRPTLPGFFTTTTSIPTTTVAETTIPRTTMVPGQFLLGEPTGLWLFYGGADPLQRVDLDTGELIEFGIEAHPVASTGEHVVLYQAESKVAGWVSAAEPGQQALSWKSGQVAPDDEAGRLWILDRSRDRDHPSGEPVGPGEWQLFETATNLVLDRRPGELYDEVEAVYAESRLVGGRFEVLRPGPDLSTRPDGVYRYDEAGNQLIDSGHLFTYDDGHALLGRCPADEPCSFTWIDRAAGAAAERPVPEGRIVFAELLAGGEWLHAVGRSSRSQLINLTTGERLEYERGIEPTISPDGRWLGLLSDDVVTLVDMVGNREPVEYRGLNRRQGGDLLFVER
ncbi:MAG: hypothetical protein ACR2QK_12695 [Acidimicrobiales bacterium]